jgi:Holliday junction resolvasome RuvABC endonuclease subunit
MKIISIDPGYERVGIAVLEKTQNKESLAYSDCFKTSAENY